MFFKRTDNNIDANQTTDKFIEEEIIDTNNMDIVDAEDDPELMMNQPRLQIR